MTASPIAAEPPLDIGPDGAIHLATKYDRAVPRYTSYPTAPHFGPAVDGDTYRRWLAELDPAGALSLYLHIPFCDEMCWFCGCYTKVVNRYEPIAEYLDRLVRETDLVAATLPRRFTVRHVHLGGGSPSLLRSADLLRLIDGLRARFSVGSDAEIAIELDPRDTTRDYVAALASAGVNRVSIGVQDFDAEVQAAINRHQPFEVVAQVCAWLRDLGIDRINLDLMYGLPHQTLTRVLDMVDRAVSLGPSRIALFGYAHVPWMKTHQKLIDAESLPDGIDRWRQLRGASLRLGERGYRPVGLDHFARADDDLDRASRKGRLCRNFQGYTTDDAPVLLGFGASAIGSLPQGYVQNAAPLHEYRDRIDAGRPATVRGVALSADDRLRRWIIERLMCDLTVDLNAAPDPSGAATACLNEAYPKLEPLIGDGLVAIEAGRIRVTAAGRPFVRLAAAAFDAYLGSGEGKHSRAV
jgi:oxygen-independent coproporphyrinogen-3 oxidase